eukprot:102163-Alexandrium_andersonii.AAC.1
MACVRVVAYRHLSLHRYATDASLHPAPIHDGVGKGPPVSGRDTHVRAEGRQLLVDEGVVNEAGARRGPPLRVGGNDLLAERVIAKAGCHGLGSSRPRAGPAWLLTASSGDAQGFLEEDAAAEQRERDRRAPLAHPLDDGVDPLVGLDVASHDQ